jgi:hypothetical protein
MIEISNGKTSKRKHARFFGVLPDMDAELLSRLDGDNPGLNAAIARTGRCTSLNNPVRVGNFPIAKT